MTAYDCVGDGFSITDPEVDDMYTAYDTPRSCFYVIEEAGTVLGVGGIGPLIGADTDVCELKKMYFLPELRGRGFGDELMQRCIQTAIDLGYMTCYLETVDRMTAANGLYQKHGFKLISDPMGATGHGGCDRYYAKAL
jgi:putative acetyltransferase